MRKRQRGAVLKKGGPSLGVVRDVVESLILRGEVETNWAWAKAVQPQIDRLVNLAGREGGGGVRRVARFLRNKRELTERLIGVIVPQLKGRVSGFTRVWRVGERKGDGVLVGRLSWVVEIKEEAKAEEKKGEVVKVKEGGKDQVELEKGER